MIIKGTNLIYHILRGVSIAQDEITNEYKIVHMCLGMYISNKTKLQLFTHFGKQLLRILTKLQLTVLTIALSQDKILILQYPILNN